jgi:hypothetical protein
MSKRIKAEASGLAPPAKRGKRVVTKPEQNTRMGLLVRDLADLYESYSKISDAPEILEAMFERCEETGEKTGDLCQRYDTSPVLLKDLAENLWDQTQALARYIAHTEPDSTEDVATLSLLFAEALDDFEEYIDVDLYEEGAREFYRNNRPALDDERRHEFRRDKRYLTMLARKIERGLQDLAPSPAAKHIGSGDRRRRLWGETQETLSTAERIIADAQKTKDAA